MADTVTGIKKSDSQRYHFDIYAILEGAQEMYFGHETQVNVNQVERVTIEITNEQGKPERLKKCYLSPTKRRGVERRALLWAPHKDGKLLGDKQQCGIPKTCTEEDCPICYVYGALDLQKKKRTLIGRVTHGGGVAVQALDAEEKQRAMHPSGMVRDSKGDMPTPFRREYNEPGLYYPVYNHALSVSEDEFVPVAYAFLDALTRLGAGNPKGVRLAEYQGHPLVVVDQYLVPKGKRPVLSPHECSAKAAVDYFVAQAQSTRDSHLTFGESVEGELFSRWSGDEALKKLEAWSETFATTHLMG